MGYGSGALGVLDAATGEVVARLPLDAHPESFQLEQAGPWVQEVGLATPGQAALLAA